MAYLLGRQDNEWTGQIEGAVMMGIIQGKTGVNIHGLDGVLDMDVC